MKGIKKAVKAYLESNNETMDGLAWEIGIGKSTLYAKLAGVTELTLSEAWRLSRVLGVSVDDLYAMTVAA